MERRQRELIDPGALRTWVTFQRRTISQDADGFEVVTVTDILRTKVRWSPARGAYENRFSSEREEDKAKRLLTVGTVTMRYSPKVLVTDQVKLGNDIYEIISINNLYFKNHFAKLDVQMVERGE